jgi:hypothetical protein
MDDRLLKWKQRPQLLALEAYRLPVEDTPKLCVPESDNEENGEGLHPPNGGENN